MKIASINQQPSDETTVAILIDGPDDVDLLSWFVNNLPRHGVLWRGKDDQVLLIFEKISDVRKLEQWILRGCNKLPK